MAQHQGKAGSIWPAASSPRQAWVVRVLLALAVASAVPSPQGEKMNGGKEKEEVGKEEAGKQRRGSCLPCIVFTGKYKLPLFKRASKPL